MKKENLKNAPTVTKQTAMIIAAITFAFGFLTGAGFMFFKNDQVPNVVSNSGTTMSPAQKAKALEAEVMINPQNTNAWIQLGHIYFDTDNYDQAINAYEKALKLKPNNANVLTDLGIMYRRSGQFHKAIERFDKAIMVDPKHQNARFTKGIVLRYDLKDRDGAIRTWEDLLEIHPFAMVGNNQSLDQFIRQYKESHDKNTSN